MADRYTVQPNRCKCHPETCCCLPWHVFDGKERLVGCFTKAIAERITSALNGANGVKESS
jgi:hypothetical protein